MRPVQDILLGVADQVLVHDALEGRPSSVTSVTVYRWDSSDDGEEELATSGAPAIETDPNTTTDADAGPGQTDSRRIPLTDTTGVTADRSFLLVDDDGREEWIDVQEVDVGDAVYARHPLHNDYAAGASFVSTRMSVVVDSTWAADEANLDSRSGPNPMFRVRWVYVVAGVTYVADTYFNLVRYAGKHGVLPKNVDDMRPGWLHSLPTDHRVDQGRRLIEEAYRAVKLDLHQVLIDDSAVAESEVIDELVRYKTIELTEWARFLGTGGDESRHLSAEKKYTTRFNALVKLTTKVPVRDVDGAGRTVAPIGLTQR